MTPILVLDAFGPVHRSISKNRRESAQVSGKCPVAQWSFAELRS
jgi:hypothetical protein